MYMYKLCRVWCKKKEEREKRKVKQSWIKRSLALASLDCKEVKTLFDVYIVRVYPSEQYLFDTHDVVVVVVVAVVVSFECHT